MRIGIVLFGLLILAGCQQTTVDRWAPRVSTIGESELDPVAHNDTASIWVTIYNTSDVDGFSADFVLPPDWRIKPRSLKTVFIPALEHSNNVQASYYAIYEGDDLGTYNMTVDVSAGGKSASLDFEINVVPSAPSVVVWGIGSVARYVDYPPLPVDVENPRGEPLAGIELVASCAEADYPSVKTYYRGALDLSGGERRWVDIPYSSGFPYFTSSTISCSIDAEHNGNFFWVDRPNDLLQ